MLYPPAQFPLYVSGCLFSKMSHCYFNCDLKACYSLGFIYIASYYSTQVCPIPRCADISHYLCVVSEGVEEPVKQLSSQDGVFSYEYHPSSPGKYIVSITWGGQHIPKRWACMLRVSRHYLIWSESLGLLGPQETSCSRPRFLFVTSVKQIAFLSFSSLFPCVNISNGVGFLRSKEHISEDVHESEG